MITVPTDRRPKVTCDMLADVRKSCNKYGLKLALYFSEGEFQNNSLYHLGAYRPEIKKAQLKELLMQAK
jgi:alpha-L-fucosidase